MGSSPPKPLAWGLADSKPMALYFLLLPALHPHPMRSWLADVGDLCMSPSLDIKSCSWPKCLHFFLPTAGRRGTLKSEPWMAIQEAESMPRARGQGA